MTRSWTSRRLLVFGFVLSAFWPRFVGLDDLPDHPLAPALSREAIRMFWLSDDNPIERIFLQVTVMNLRLSNWTDRAGTCAGGKSTWPELQDVAVTVTIVGPWGLPLGQETISCGGAAWQR